MPVGCGLPASITDTVVLLLMKEYVFLISSVCDTVLPAFTETPPVAVLRTSVAVVPVDKVSSGFTSITKYSTIDSWEAISMPLPPLKTMLLSEMEASVPENRIVSSIPSPLNEEITALATCADPIPLTVSPVIFKLPGPPLNALNFSALFPIVPPTRGEEARVSPKSSAFDTTRAEGCATTRKAVKQKIQNSTFVIKCVLEGTKVIQIYSINQ